MRRHRTTVAFLLLAGVAAALLATPIASGSERGAVPRLVFPLVAKTDLWDNYGDPRPNGRHAGIDLENPWRAPVVAVEGGKVEYATSNLGGCMLYLYGRSGTMYLYIHLNNDLTARNDNKGGCVEETTYAVPDGAKVTAGQQVAWNGDSGDASGNPHLHFEVHPNGGEDTDPFTRNDAESGQVAASGLRLHAEGERDARGDRGRAGRAPSRQDRTGAVT